MSTKAAQAQRSTTPSATKTGGKSLVETVVRLDGLADSAFVDLAAALYLTKKGDAQVAAGYTADHAGFASFCDERLKLGYRKAQYLIGIHEMALEHQIPKEVMETIGWSKLKEVVPYITPENKNELINAAQEMPLKALLEFLANFKKKTKKPQPALGADASTENTVKYNFLIAEADNDTVKLAIQEAKNRLETDNAAEAFVTICEDWLALGGGALPNTLEDYLVFIERHFGVKLVIPSEAETAPVATKPASTPKTAKVSTPPVTSPAVAAPAEVAPQLPADDVNPYAALYDVKVDALKAFAAENGIIIPPTIKTKTTIRDFIISECLKRDGANAATEAPGTSEGLEEGVVNEEATGSVDLATADAATLISRAAEYGLDIPAKLKKPNQLEALRSFVIESFKVMGIGEDTSNALDGLNADDNGASGDDDDEAFAKAIVAAEEERDALYELTDLKSIVAFVKERGYGEAYKAEFGQPTKDLSVEQFQANVLHLIGNKYDVDFPAEPEEGLDL